jgi:hypothetical protein
MNLTIVTGIWDLGRDKAGEGFARSFDHYKEKFVELLQTDVPMFIYIEEKYESLVWEHRDKENTFVKIKEVDEFRKQFPFYDTVQEIRGKESWKSQASWMPDSTQATMELYNPMVMSKMFMLNDASIFNPFDTDHFLWVDGAITNTVHEGYFTKDKILDKMDTHLNKFLFLCFPYKDYSEVHGFEKGAISRYSKTRLVEWVARGGVFGGHKDFIKEANGLYYQILQNSLSEGYMGTEESIFTIMSYLKPKRYKRFMIKDDGLISTFFEALKNDEVELEETDLRGDYYNFDSEEFDIDEYKTALYIITYNSPAQLELLLESYWGHNHFLFPERDNHKKYLIDNSIDESTQEGYKKLCSKYGLEHIKKDNIGICGGRQLAAEHFGESDADYMIFLEDDMLLHPKDHSSPCKNGFRTCIDDLFVKAHKVIVKEGFDFLKLSFSEFFGDNITQWAWYNVPQEKREEYWPEYSELPIYGLDQDSPKTKFNNIGCVDDLPYVDGDIYYCNWPQIVSKEGNKKIFLDTTWAHPFEQTWMSHAFQLTKEGKLKGGILLISPINHHRKYHYKAEERVES